MGLNVPVEITKANYLAKKKAGTLNANTYYNVIDEYDSANVINDSSVTTNSTFSSTKSEKTYAKKNAKVNVKVQDTTAPVITCEDSITIAQNEKFDINNYVSLNEEGTVELNKTVDTSNVGSITTTIQAKDKAGNVSKKDVTINVEKDFYQRIADAALAQVGVNQDCTMLVTNSLAAVGINFHGAPTAYLSLGELTNNPVPGDICVYQGHVAIYIGNGQAVHGGWNGCQTTVYSVQCANPFIGYVHVSR